MIWINEIHLITLSWIWNNHHQICHLILLCICNCWRNLEQSRNKIIFNYIYFWNFASFKVGNTGHPNWLWVLSRSPCLSHSLQSTGCIFYNSFLHIQPFYLVRFLWNLLGVYHVVYWLEINSLLRCSVWETNKRKRNQYHTWLIMKID